MSTHTLVSPASAPGSAHLHPEEAAANQAAEAATDNIHRVRITADAVRLFMCIVYLQFTVNWQ